MLSDKSRAVIDITHTRSSKPGGQAANVGESHVTVRLTIDNVLTVVSESQDTRSAHNNEQTAVERLYSVHIPLANEKLKRTSISLPSTNHIEADRWNHYNSMVEKLSPIDMAVAATVRNLTTKKNSV